MKKSNIMKLSKEFIVLSILTGFFTLILILLPLWAQNDEVNDECLACHDDPSLTTEGKNKKSVYLNKIKFSSSIHRLNKCIDCHYDLKDADFPHEKPKKAQCGTNNCHPTQNQMYFDGLHGKASKRGDPLAPNCQFCHGSHEITKINDPKSVVSPLKIPFLCGKCHREGSPVQIQRNIPQSHILENYTESIHGEGLLKKGLVVTATCASCHTSHLILPHTDPRSSIARKNIASTCTKCHAKIEDVHVKIIKGELWEKEAHVLPACVDCHQPHKARKVFYEQGMADSECLKCHSKPYLKSANRMSMFVNTSEIHNSSHSRIACSQCHTGVEPSHLRPCDNIKKNVDCASCHAEIGNDFNKSMHGQLYNVGDKDAPYCTTCHGTHNVIPVKYSGSQVFRTNIPKLCAKCHQDGKRAAVRITGGITNIIQKYTESIHGKGLTKSGLTVTATCTDCHSSHKELNHKDPNSSTYMDNIANTCGNCHYGIKNTFEKSIHSPLISKSNKKLPSCKDCHSPHTIMRTDENRFRFDIMNTCGKCHKQISETFFDTYHGKVSRLGLAKAAKCSDCHGAHDILPPDNPDSHLSRNNILSTCQKCHESANKKFAGYLTHATHHDPDKYPWLFLTFWGMTILLISVFIISWLHTLLWLPRSLQMRKLLINIKSDEHSGLRIIRFKPLDRVLHVLMILSFIILATTGMTLKFSYTSWSQSIVNIIGGVESTGWLHRFAATILFGVFITHIVDLFKQKRLSYNSWKEMLFGPNTMLPTKKDIKDFVGSIKWFLGIGPRPEYGRWTYWEKFDYFAVFWGIFIIGSTGLMLWFPSFFTNIFHGSFLNIATIIHSDEALLAAGFIFTVHFFNTHFRPEKFPMDTVIFTGSYDIEEFKRDRPFEYEKLVESGKLQDYIVNPPSPAFEKAIKIFGWAALTTGIFIVIWIIYSMLVVYR